jgi:hypothetical protein
METKIKYFFYFTLLIFVVLVLQRYFNFIRLPKQSFEEKKALADLKLEHNLKQTFKSFADTKKMTVSVKDFEKYIESYIEAWENGRVDLVIAYLTNLKNDYDFGYLIEIAIKKNANIHVFSNRWTSANKQKYSQFAESHIRPKITQLEISIQKDLGAYGKDLLKIINNQRIYNR